MSQVTLTIDGKEVRVDSSQTIFDAAQQSGIDIPHLCFHKKLSRTGACRMCVVEVEKAKTLMSSCTTPVVQGMVVYTESLRVVAARRLIIDLLLANHPLDCLTCEYDGTCRL